MNDTLRRYYRMATAVPDEMREHREGEWVLWVDAHAEVERQAEEFATITAHMRDAAEMEIAATRAASERQYDQGVEATVRMLQAEAHLTRLTTALEGVKEEMRQVAEVERGFDQAQADLATRIADQLVDIIGRQEGKVR